MTESDGVIYQFDDINQLRFIIPFDTETQHAHLYVKPKANFDFVLIKKFDEEMRQDITNKIDYVLTVLKDYDLKITNRDQFYECIGVTVQKTDIRDIQQSKLLYASTVLGARTTCLQRLVQELKVTELSNMLCVFELKMECVDNCKSFNCSIFQIVSNSGYEQKDLFSQNEYKLVSYSHADDAKDEEIVFQYNAKIIVSNNTSQYKSHKVLVSNPELFGVDHYIELQHIDGPSVSQFSNAFYNALTVLDDRIICIRNHHRFMPDYGEYSVVAIETGYLIVAKSFYPTIRPNCTLRDGKYCFEVKIVSISDRINIGFAEQGFVP
eukprot:163038_1